MPTTAAAALPPSVVFTEDLVEVHKEGRAFRFTRKSLMLLIGMYFPALAAVSLVSVVQHQPDFVLHIAKKHGLPLIGESVAKAPPLACKKS